MGIVADAISQFEQPVSDFVSNAVSQLSSAATQPVTLGATLYIAIVGVMIAQGRVQVPVGELVWSIFRIGIVIMLVTKVDTYNEYVVNIFHKALPEGISQVLISGGGSISADQIKSGAAFDTLIERVRSAGGNVIKSAGITDVGTVIFGYLFIIVCTVVIVLISAVVIYAKIGLAIILAVGPLFIGMAIFNATRPFTSSWVSQLANFVILQILVFALFGLLLTLMDTASTNMVSQTGGQQIATAVNVMALLVLALYFGSQLPAIAGAMSSGGVALGNGLMLGALNSSRNMATAAARPVVGMARSAGSAVSSSLSGSNSVSKGA